MAQKIIQDGVAVGFGWKKATENLGFLLAVTLVFVVAEMIIFLIAGWLGGLHWILGIIFTLAAFLAVTYLSLGFAKIMLKIVDGQKASFGDLFARDLNVVTNFILTSLLYSSIVSVGLLLLIVPGVIFGLKFLFAPLLAIDKGLGPIEALKQSSAMTDGVKWDLIGFYQVISLVISIGVAALFVGILVALPTSILALLYVYRNLAIASNIK